MIRLRFILLAAIAGLLIVGCKDTRRDLARAYLLTHPPAGFAVVSVPDNLPIHEVSADTGEITTSVRYRSINPTIEIRDGFALPAAQAVDERFRELRGWALSALPADAPLRAEILSAIADAHGAFPVKRIVTPAGTEIDALATLTLHRTDSGWNVTGMQCDASVPGSPEADVPLADSPATAARIAELKSIAEQLDSRRARYLAERKQTAERSLAALRRTLRTGETFSGALPDGTPLRLVVTRGLNSPEPAVAVLTAQGVEQSTARFTGALEQTASGETIWRASQATTLGKPSTGVVPASLDGGRHPTLILSLTGSQLNGELVAEGAPVRLVRFRPAGAVELIPEAPTQPSNSQ